jgi:hypothetical protein
VALNYESNGPEMIGPTSTGREEKAGSRKNVAQAHHALCFQRPAVCDEDPFVVYEAIIISGRPSEAETPLTMKFELDMRYQSVDCMAISEHCLVFPNDGALARLSSVPFRNEDKFCRSACSTYTKPLLEDGLR